MNKDLLDKIERVLDIKFYDWQRKYLLKEPMLLDMRITGRTTGKTLVWVIEKLFEGEEPLDMRDRRKILKVADWWCCENREDRALGGHYLGWYSWYRGYFKEIYEELNDAGIKTRLVIF